MVEVFDEKEPEGVSVKLIEGYPTLVLMAQSQDADLLILGNRGHSPIIETFLGSVSYYCIAHAKCPVLIIKE